MMCLPLQDTSGQVKGQALRLGAVHKGRGMLLGNAWQLTVSVTADVHLSPGLTNVCRVGFQSLKMALIMMT